MNTTATLIKGSDNAVTVVLTNDGDPIVVSWTEIDVYIGRPALVTINRTDDEDGVEFAAGELSITPADLLQPERDAIAALADDTLYELWVRVKDAINDDGVDFGANDSEDAVLVYVQSRP
jgi:hypothetical protein